jgi:hypothetical protein
MSRDSVEEVVRRAHEAFSRGDRDAFVVFWAEECEYQPAWERYMGGDEVIFRGHDGIRRWWQDMSDAWADWRTDVHEIRQTGDQVLNRITLRAKGRLSGAAMEQAFSQVVTIREGKIVSCRDFADHDQALEACGLRD